MTSFEDAPVERGGLMFSTIWFPGRWEDRLAELADCAQPEPWGEPGDPAEGYGTLSSYLRFSFARILEEDKLRDHTNANGERFGAFNTGLFTPNYQPIVGLLEPNRNPDRQPWVFKGWVTPNDRRLSAFNPAELTPPFYFHEPAELLYDPRLPLEANLDHILDDNVERWPEELQGDPVRRRLLLDGSIREVGKRVQMNWRIAVPQFYWPSGRFAGRIQLLLPLRFSGQRPADLALVVDRRRDHYVAYTVLTLDMAYRNARLICRPESDWLGGQPVVDLDLAADTTEPPQWRRVSSADRCPICGEPQGCLMSADNRTAVCKRVSDGGEHGITSTGINYWTHVLHQ